MAIKASFSPSTLSVFGDNLDNTIITSRDADGNILINGGVVSIDGGQPTVANTTAIVVSGGNGNDTISLDNGALPPAQLFGGQPTHLDRHRRPVQLEPTLEGFAITRHERRVCTVVGNSPAARFGHVTLLTRAGG